MAYEYDADSGSAFEFESRPGGCDIRPPRQKPVMETDGAEYAYVIPDEADAARPGAWGGRSESRAPGPGGLLTSAGVLLGAILAMWVFAVSSPFLANALTLHGWRFFLALILGCLPAAAALGAMAYAAARFRKIPRVEQLSASAFPNKAELQRRLASLYIGRFPDPERYAADNGFADGEGDRTRAEVVACLNRLRTSAADSRGWLIEFDRLQSMQDRRADEIIRRTWQLVAIKTAASPWKIVDMIAVIYNSTVMVTRLARLYNRRTSRPAALRLVCRWFINIFIAGEMGDATQGAVEWASANDLISSTYKPLAGFVGRIAEGGANAFLIYRLGCRAKLYFRALAR